MCRYMAFARIFLIFSIINFALAAAPGVVRRVHEVHANVVGVDEDGAATSQKRWDDWLANAADRTSASTTTLLSDLDHSGLYSQGSNNARSSSALSTGPHLRSKDDFPLPSPEPANLAILKSVSKSESEDPLYKQLKRKIRRRMYGSGAASLAQSEVRAIVDPRP